MLWSFFVFVIESIEDISLESLIVHPITNQTGPYINNASLFLY